jgi:hypothetical protein
MQFCGGVCGRCGFAGVVGRVAATPQGLRHRAPGTHVRGPDSIIFLLRVILSQDLFGRMWDRFMATEHLAPQADTRVAGGQCVMPGVVVHRLGTLLSEVVSLEVFQRMCGAVLWHDMWIAILYEGAFDSYVNLVVCGQAGYPLIGGGVAGGVSAHVRGGAVADRGRGGGRRGLCRGAARAHTGRRGHTGGQDDGDGDDDHDHDDDDHDDYDHDDDDDDQRRHHQRQQQEEQQQQQQHHHHHHHHH